MFAKTAGFWALVAESVNGAVSPVTKSKGFKRKSKLFCRSKLPRCSVGHMAFYAWRGRSKEEGDSPPQKKTYQHSNDIACLRQSYALCRSDQGTRQQHEGQMVMTTELPPPTAVLLTLPLKTAMLSYQWPHDHCHHLQQSHHLYQQ